MHLGRQWHAVQQSEPIKKPQALWNALWLWQRMLRKTADLQAHSSLGGEKRTCGEQKLEESRIRTHRVGSGKSMLS